jgi:hypothetical protein
VPTLNPAGRQMVQDLQTNLVAKAKEKECSASTLSSSSNNSSSSSVVGRLPEPVPDRGSRSRKVERRDHRKKRQRPSHNSSDIIIAAVPDENSGAAFVVAAFDSFAPALSACPSMSLVPDGSAVSNAWRSPQ